jgi:tryptophan-rich sensory protein
MGVCVCTAALEGVCAGSTVKQFFSTLKLPSYSAPLWVWSIIGGGYYLTFGFVLYRLLRLDSSGLRTATLTLVLFMAIVNALTNYVIFRARNLYLSFLIGCLFPFLDATLLICLIRLDTLAACALVPYLIYRIYAVWWGFALWTLNRTKEA